MWLTSSMASCICRNNGTIFSPANTIIATIIGTATQTSQDSPASSRKAITTPPTAIMGASTSMLMLAPIMAVRSEEHTSELQSRGHLVCRLLLEIKKTTVLDIEAHVFEYLGMPLI